MRSIAGLFGVLFLITIIIVVNGSSPSDDLFLEPIILVNKSQSKGLLEDPINVVNSSSQSEDLFEDPVIIVNISSQPKDILEDPTILVNSSSQSKDELDDWDPDSWKKNLNVTSSHQDVEELLEKEETTTTSTAKPVEINNFDSELLADSYFIKSIKQYVSEKIPERPVYPKGIGAHGYFEVTNNIENYCQAKLFQEVGKKTPVFARMSPGQVDKGGSDTTALAMRSISFKFNTEEGNLDFLSINTPVFHIRSPVTFAASVRAMNRKNSQTNLLDRTSLFDFVLSHPQSLHWLFWAASEFGLPRGFRHMNGFPIHTYQIYNDRGQCFFVRFKFLAELGYRSLTPHEALNISRLDPDFFIRDLYESIEFEHFPAWRMEMDVLTKKQVETAYFDPFDVMSLWPKGTYKIVPIGRIVLNDNVENHFKEVEISAFNPANLVPGIGRPTDMLFKGRVMAYIDSEVHRLGVNYNKIGINFPKTAYNYSRTQVPYLFSYSINGTITYVAGSNPSCSITERKEDPVSFKQAWYFYNEILKKESQKKRLIDVLVREMIRVVHPMQQKFIILLSKVDTDIATRFMESLAEYKSSIKHLPMLSNYLDPDELP